jgi:ATP-binding cassette subfamily C protein
LFFANISAFIVYMKFKRDDYKNLAMFFKDLMRASGRQVIVSFLLQILTGLTQGIGLLMLIPLLGIVGIFQNQAKSSKFVGELIDFLHKTGLPEGIVTILLFYILVVSLNSWLNSYQTINNAKIQQRFVRHLKDKLYTSIGHSEWQFVSQMRLSDIAHVITTEVQQSGQVIFQILRMSGTLITVLAYLSVAFMLSAKMAFLSLIGALLLLLIGRKKNTVAYNLGKAGQKSMKKVFQIVIEHLSGMKVAKSFAEEDRYISEFIQYSEDVEKRKIDYARLSARTSLFFSIGTVVLLSFYVYLAIGIVGLPATTLLVLIYIFSNLLPKVSTLQTSFQSILQSLPAFTSVNELQNLCNINNEKLIRNQGKGEKTGGAIELRNIAFRYGKTPLFEDISLLIPANSIVCFTGKSGSGKTTLADIILGLLKPSSGSVLIDGKILNEEILFNWRKSIGYVTQESFLFNDTIRNNLLWTNQEASESEIKEALVQSSADEMVDKLELGLETIVGDRGAKLSGGERQRLALARALLRKPTMLLLDEATSALDPVNENKIIEALEKLKGKTTMIIISHSPEIHRIADKIYCFENGRINETS